MISQRKKKDSEKMGVERTYASIYPYRRWESMGLKKKEQGEKKQSKQRVEREAGRVRRGGVAYCNCTKQYR